MTTMYPWIFLFTLSLFLFFLTGKSLIYVIICVFLYIPIFGGGGGGGGVIFKGPIF